MVALREIKKKIVEDSVREGRSTATGEISQQWITNLSRTWEPQWREHPRLVNHFEISTAVQVGGMNLQRSNGFLRGDSKYGISSIHTASSRRVLDLVAAMGRGLQAAMGLHGTACHQYHSGGMGKDSPLGGRIRFARTTPTSRLREVSALDVVMELMLGAGVWSKDHQRMRNQWKHTPLGLPGDWKPREGGWEYRGFPSFVHSPWEMMLTLTLAKLAVCRPDLFGVGYTFVEKFSPESKIKFILSYFRGLDDDAELCWEMLRVYGLPRPQEMHTMWSLHDLPTHSVNAMLVAEVSPAATSTQTLFHRMMKNLPMQVVEGRNELFTLIPKGWIRDSILNMGLKREGETVPAIKFGSYGVSISAPSWWLKRQSKKLQGISTQPQNIFFIDRRWKQKNPRRFRELFLDGSIGRWTIEAVVAGETRGTTASKKQKILVEAKY